MEQWFGEVGLLGLYFLAIWGLLKNEKSIEREWRLNKEKKEGYNLDFPGLRETLSGDEWLNHVDKHFSKKEKLNLRFVVATIFIGGAILTYFGVRV
jgi:hypothetical protein